MTTLQKMMLALVVAASATTGVYADTLAKNEVAEWKDPATGLIWTRCSVGQSWNGSECTGLPLQLSWHDAQSELKSMSTKTQQWRLPTTQELLTIVSCSEGLKDTVFDPSITDPSYVMQYCYDGSKRPTIDGNTFPNTFASFYWTGSQYVGSWSFSEPKAAWGVYFDYGYAMQQPKDSLFFTRGVRKAD